MDAAEVRQVFERTRARAFDPRLRRVRGRYRFDVEGIGAFRVHVDRGRLEVLEGAGDADCVIRCDPRDFLRIARGEQNLVTAFMQGRIELEGDLALAQKLHGILPGPDAASNARGAP